ncbi:MAG: hypothetical protein ACREYC_25725 [Gammaproteobacteria bacterium]
MEQKVTLQVVRKGEISAIPAWDDPYGLARLTPQKRSALLNNPLSRSEDDPAQILGLLANKVIGRIDLIPGELLVNGQTVPMLWPGAYDVPEEHRRTLVGVMIVLKMMSLHHTIGVCGVSQMALPIFQKLNWLAFTQPRYLLLRRSRSVVERYVGTGAAAALVIKAADAALLAHEVALRNWTAIKGKNLRLHEVSEMSSNMDAELRHFPQPVGIYRSAAWFNWLLRENFEDDPTRRKGLFYVSTQDGRMVGYFFLRMRLFEQASHRGFKHVLLGSLHDWMSFDRDHLTDYQIAMLATLELESWGADAVEICTDNSDLQRSLKRTGFFRLGQLHTFFCCGKVSPIAEKFKEQSDWRLRPADGVNFF